MGRIADERSLPAIFKIASWVSAAKAAGCIILSALDTKVAEPTQGGLAVVAANEAIGAGERGFTAGPFLHALSRSLEFLVGAP